MNLNGVNITNNTESVGYKNPCRYRGYWYNIEIGLYYLNSRYYNPEWGRFMNADALGGQVAELLSHNMFIYCKNNPVNMHDPNGYWGISTLMSSVKSVFTTAVNTVKNAFTTAKNYIVGYLPSKEQLGDIGRSTLKGFASGMADEIGGRSGKAICKKRIVGWKSYGNKTLTKAIKEPVKSSIKYIKVAGLVGTIGFTGYDALESWGKGERVGAGIDILSGLAGVALGAGVGAMLAPTALPTSVVAGGGFVLSVLGGVVIDKYATYRKNVHYGR